MVIEIIRIIFICFLQRHTLSMCISVFKVIKVFMYTQTTFYYDFGVILAHTDS